MALQLLTLSAPISSRRRRTTPLGQGLEHSTSLWEQLAEVYRVVYVPEVTALPAANWRRLSARVTFALAMQSHLNSALRKSLSAD